MQEPTVTRRSLMQSAAWSTLALVLPFSMTEAEAKQAKKLGEKSQPLAPNAFIVLAPDNTITVYAKHLEMGQGVYTGLSTILAEELDADWDLIRVESAPADAKLYSNLFRSNNQGTGGSNSIANSWTQLRKAGAQARMMLLAAASETFKVPVTELKTEKSHVLHPATGRRKSYGELVPKARNQPIPENPPLKSRDQFRLIGQDRKMRIDGREKTNGQAKFAIDVMEEGKIIALIARPPQFGAQVKNVRDKVSLKVKGVLEVIQIPQGVAVLAENFWAAKKGRDALEIDWDDSRAFKGSTDDIRKEYTALLQKPGTVAFSQGDFAGQMKDGSRSLDATFSFPYLAHAPMEPLNCVIKHTTKTCEIWAGSQSQTRDQGLAAKILGLAPEQVTIHTMLAGGSFGRRSNPTSDYVSEAAEVAKATRFKERPIHLMWTREDDIRGGYYRPFVMHRVVAGLDAKDKALFWHHRIVSQSIIRALRPTAPSPNDIDPTSVEGANKIPYEVPHRQCELHTTEVQVPILWWRSVGHNHTAFVVESIIDELATMAKQDPVAFRLDLMKDEARSRAVLKKAASMAEWGRTLPKDSGIGVAAHASFGSYVAQVAQVSIADGKYKVEKIWCAVDCGIAVNPDIIKAQMEGSIGFALSALQKEVIHFQNGKVQESNFHDYQPLRMTEMPHIEVAIIPSEAEPTGVGEPGVPPLAPAVANAIAHATGKRLRELPLRLEG
jgi:isoquinoline 1-oxidoreductase beta subunit